MRKLLIIAIVFCSVIFLIGAQAGFAKPRNTIISAVSEDCFNGIDDDEDSLIDCVDPDCENVQNGTCETGLSGICAEGTLSCVAGAGQCVQNNQPVAEICDDGIDNDCDGLVDTADPECVQPPVEDCFNGIDDDEDGMIDCADPICEGAQNGICETGLSGICAEGTLACVAGAGQCVQNNQPVAEICDDGIDNDCDGLIDGADPDCVQPPVEDCFNGIDDDGDNLIDCADLDCENAQNGTCETGLSGICAEGTLACVAGAGQCVQNNQPVAEICDDGIDNDCDGLVDAADPDCAIGDKVTICHIPRRNPARAHTITIDAESLPEHLAHGDTIGPCENSSMKHKKQFKEQPKKTRRLHKGFK